VKRIASREYATGAASGLGGRAEAGSAFTREPASYESYQRLNSKPDFDRLVSSCVRMWLDSEDSGYPANKIAQIEGDVLIVRGDGDHLFTRRQAANLADRSKGSVFANVPFAGHAAHEDQPDMCVRIVEEFLRSAPKH
jgi:pimeloyl-ACP methyl ester carboxylesterase